MGRTIDGSLRSGRRRLTLLLKNRLHVHAGPDGIENRLPRWLWILNANHLY